MAIENHPLALIKGSQEARDLMAQVRAHRGKTAAAVIETPPPANTIKPKRAGRKRIPDERDLAKQIVARNQKP